MASDAQTSGMKKLAVTSIAQPFRQRRYKAHIMHITYLTRYGYMQTLDESVRLLFKAQPTRLLQHVRICLPTHVLHRALARPLYCWLARAVEPRQRQVVQ
jgi:hypothetical protein